MSEKERRKEKGGFGHEQSLIALDTHLTGAYNTLALSYSGK